MIDMRVAILLAALTGMSACTATSTPLAARMRAPYTGAILGVPGEGMEYEISFRGMTVGRVLVAVGQPGVIAGKRAIIIRTHGTSIGLVAMAADVNWELTSTLDLDRGVPLSSREVGTVIAAGKRHHHDKQRTWDDSGVHDLHSMIGVVRAWPVKPGEDLELEVKIDGLRTDATFHEAAREVIAKHAMPAIRYDGTAKDGRYPFRVWVSDDTARVPLRLIADTKFGTVRVELVSYEAPREE